MLFAIANVRRSCLVRLSNLPLIDIRFQSNPCEIICVFKLGKVSSLIPSYCSDILPEKTYSSDIYHSDFPFSVFSEPLARFR